MDELNNTLLQNVFISYLTEKKIIYIKVHKIIHIIHSIMTETGLTILYY